MVHVMGVAMPDSAAASPCASHVVVVGAGWAGWGAAKALAQSGVAVTLIDGLADPSGSKPMTTASGKPFEAGTRGFWKDYPNINALCAELNLPEMFTAFTTSAFWSPDGLEATAPVFADALPLPSPLGQMFATLSNFRRLPVADRLSIAALLYAMADFNRNEQVFRRYDAISAQTLFKQLGVSDRMINDFLRPILLVGLFKPPEELSAAVTLELLYFYALAHQDSFDVRWINAKSIAEQLIAPLARQLQRDHGLQVQGATLATRLNLCPDTVQVCSVETRCSGSGQTALIEDVDAVVLALGAKGMGVLMQGSPQCAAAAPELVAAGRLEAIDVVSVRLWLDVYVPVADPANVFSRFAALEGAGGTFFMLDQLQKGAERDLWGGEQPRGSVIASDFYNASALAQRSDQHIIELLLQELLPVAHQGFAAASVLDAEVRRYPGSVSLFGPGSFHQRPPLETAVDSIVCAGDWVRMGQREHGAKGLCQERAYVSGLEAANSLIRRHIVSGSTATGPRTHAVLPIRADEPQVQLSRSVNAALMQPLDALGLRWPWQP
jgi:uncharacterized protein with NAD-binding domain and iron-sulfur cluster